MDYKMVFAGVGGQGIVLATRLIGVCMVEMGACVISTENHGMATRGGSVMSFVKIGDYHSPLLCYGEADVAAVLHPDEYVNVEPFLRHDTFVVGYSLDNATVDIRPVMERAGIHPRYANMVASGIILSRIGVDLDTVSRALSRLGKSRRENIEAITLGYKEVDHAHVSATA